MATLLEREHLETLERPAEERKKTGRRGLWLGTAAVVIAIAAGVTGSLMLQGGEAAFKVDFDTASSYVPDGAAELTGVLAEGASPFAPRTSTYVPSGATELPMALTPRITSSYVPNGATELETALTAPSIGVEFGAASIYVPNGATELETALAAPSIMVEFGAASGYVPNGASELETALVEKSGDTLRYR